MSMEAFMAQVAWPGVQPSPLGGGEALIAQEPQPEAQPQSEVTPEATPQTSPAATPLVEVSEDKDGIADIDYAADMEAAQSTWDSWPITAQDTPQPAQDASSSPHDEPTPAQDD